MVIFINIVDVDYYMDTDGIDFSWTRSVGVSVPNFSLQIQRRHVRALSGTNDKFEW